MCAGVWVCVWVSEWVSVCVCECLRVSVRVWVLWVFIVVKSTHHNFGTHIGKLAESLANDSHLLVCAGISCMRTQMCKCDNIHRIIQREIDCTQSATTKLSDVAARVCVFVCTNVSMSSSSLCMCVQFFCTHPSLAVCVCVFACLFKWESATHNTMDKKPSNIATIWPKYVAMNVQCLHGKSVESNKKKRKMVAEKERETRNNSETG